MGRCPFPDHQEKTASFSVSETKQVYHCFGCGKSGNIFSFLRDYQGLHFPDAVEYLAQRAGLALPVVDRNLESENKEQQKKKLILKVNRLALEFFEDSLQKTTSTHMVREYLKKRGLSAETVKDFHIGYAPAEWEGLVEFLKSHNVPLTLAAEAQLLKPKNSGGFYDLFKDRLMFPILNPLGEVVAFGGRILDQGQPKYLNSPETNVFVKGRILYGLSQTAKYIRTEDLAIVVEGYMDLVSLYQSGIRNTVAVMGTAFTADHGKLIRRLTRNVLMLLDGDQAGQTAAERALPLLLAAELYPKGLILPEGMDPDDYVKNHGAEALKAQIEKAPDLVSVVMQTWLKTYKGEASEKVQFCDRFKVLIRSIRDARLKDLYVDEAARRLGVEKNWMRQALTDSQHQSAYVSANSAPTNVEVVDAAAVNASAKEVPTFEFVIQTATSLEKNALALALKSRANYEVFVNESGPEVIAHEGVQKVLQIVNEVYGQDRKQFDRLLSYLITKVDEPQALFYKDLATQFVKSKNVDTVHLDFAGETVSGSDGYESTEKLVKDVVKRLKSLRLKNQLKQLALELKMNPTAEKIDELKVLQKEFSRLSKDVESKEVEE